MKTIEEHIRRFASLPLTKYSRLTRSAVLKAYAGWEEEGQRLFDLLDYNGNHEIEFREYLLGLALPRDYKVPVAAVGSTSGSGNHPPLYRLAFRLLSEAPTASLTAATPRSPAGNEYVLASKLTKVLTSTITEGASTPPPSQEAVAKAIASHDSFKTGSLEYPQFVGVLEAGGSAYTAQLHALLSLNKTRAPPKPAATSRKSKDA